MKLALVHDDLIQFGGAERLVLAMHEIWPEAPLYTAVASKEWLQKAKSVGLEVHTSFMQKFPFVSKLNRHYAPTFAHYYAFRSFDFSQFDVVVSSSARFAHGITTPASTRHICYMNSPPRMFWEPDKYFPPLLKTVLYPVLNHYRKLDKQSSLSPNFFIANSKTPQQRIKKYYNRESDIIYPFVDLDKFRIIPTSGQSPFFLVVTRLAPWKRVDIVVKAFNTSGKDLVVIGDGSDRKRLEKMSKGNIKFLGHTSDAELVRYYKNCTALINPQKEDFGIAPLEAMACGKPVIAYRAGGALETVVEGVTGEFFDYQTPESLFEVVEQFDASLYSKYTCRAQAEKFGKERFVRELESYVLNH